MSKKNIFLSIILSLIFIVAGYLDIHRLVGFWTPSLIILISVIIISVLITRNVKKENGGYASFGSLVKHFAIAITIAITIGTIGNIVQISLLDANQKEAIVDISVEKTIEMYSRMGFNNDQLATMEDELEQKMSDSFKPSNFILSAFSQLLIYFLVSLIPAAILKKNPVIESE